MIKVQVHEDRSFTLVFTGIDLRTLNKIYKLTGVYIDDYIEAVIRIAFDSLNE